MFKIATHYTRDSDARKLLLAMAQIKMGFYQQKGFLLTQETTKNNFEIREKLIVLPKVIFKYLTSNFDWEAFDSDYWYNNYYNSKALVPTSILNLFNDLPEIKPGIDLKKIQDSINILSNLFNIPNLNIQIFFTNCGSICSFKRINEKDILLYPRLDATEKDIMEGIIAMIIRKYPWEVPWEDYQIIQSFLVIKTKIGELLGVSKDIDSKYEFSPLYLKLSTESINNYNQIGYPSVQAISLVGKSIKVLNDDCKKFLTQPEYNLLFELVEKKNSIVNFENISSILWKDPINEFSLQAISKVVERIRKKLEAQGVHKQVIFTKRGEGYIYSE